jgi:Mrr N-terminal domain
MMRRGPEERERLKELVAGKAPGHELRSIHLGCPAFREPILRALGEAGGRTTRREVFARLGEEMAEKFGRADLEDHRGAPCWNMHADLARRHLVQEGLMRSDSGAGRWVLCDAGAEALTSARDPEEGRGRGPARSLQDPVGAVVVA